MAEESGAVELIFVLVVYIMKTALLLVFDLVHLFVVSGPKAIAKKCYIT